VGEPWRESHREGALGALKLGQKWRGRHWVLQFNKESGCFEATVGKRLGSFKDLKLPTSFTIK